MLLKILEIMLGTIIGKLSPSKKKKAKQFILDLVKAAAKGGAEGLTSKAIDSARQRHGL